MAGKEADKFLVGFSFFGSCFQADFVSCYVSTVYVVFGDVLELCFCCARCDFYP